MAKPDWLTGLRDIGRWELYPWGERWTLTNDEVQIALDKIEVIKKLESAQIELVSGISFALVGLVTAGFGTSIVDGSIKIYRTLTIGNIDIFQSRIKSTNRGSGVTVDLFLSYLDLRRWLPAIASFSNPISNFCSIEPRQTKSGSN